MLCPVCSHDNDDQAGFCSHCGSRLGELDDVLELDELDDETESIIREKLGDTVRIIRELGRGGMGVVFEAIEVELERRIALKLLPLELSKNMRIVERFKREAQVAARLSHPHIVPVHAVGSVDNLHYFTMPFLEGGSLADRILDGLSIEESVDIVRQVASALDYAHRKGVIHRDIKPENIMFDEHTDCKVMDFGIAKALYKSQLTTTKAFMGTPKYTGPEQALGRTVDARSDLYALGAVFYEMVAQQPPFDGDDPLAVIYRHIHEELRPPSEANPNVPSDISSIIQQMMAKDPNERFQSGAQVVQALKTYQNQATWPPGDTTQPPPLPEKPIDRSGIPPIRNHSRIPTPSIPPPVSTRTKRMRVAVIGVSACLALTVAGLLWWLWPKAQTENDPVAATQAAANDLSSRSAGSRERATPSSEEPESSIQESDDTIDPEPPGQHADGEPESTSDAKAIAAMTDFPFSEIPGGVFKMGTVTQMEKDTWHVHEVSLSPFAMSQTEVTQGLWSAVMNDNPSCTQGQAFPVENVSYNDVQNFLKRINSLDMGFYRLPTEAEWEFACRAGAKAIGTILPGGDSLSEVGWFGRNSSDRVHEVSRKKPNDWGLYDMNGNVWEWCHDFYSPDYYEVSPYRDPQGPQTGTKRVIRGGYWNSKLNDCRCTKRSCKSPDQSSCQVGFRLVREVQPEEDRD